MADKPIQTPLPADLPTDWAANQIVSPNGTEVGLSEKHGYNYLSGAVNAAQEGVNTLNEAFENLPDNASSVPAFTSAGSSTTFTGTIPELEELQVGQMVTMIPHTTAASHGDVGLNLNGWGSKPFARVLSNNAASYNYTDFDTCIQAGEPVLLQYDGSRWVLVGHPVPAKEELVENIIIPVQVSKTGNTVAITGDANASRISFYAPSDFDEADSYTYNGTAVTLTDLLDEELVDAWKDGSPVVLAFGEERTHLFFKAGGGMNADLPPLHADFILEGGNAQITISLAAMPSEYSSIYKETWIAVKQSSAPENPKDYDYLVVLQPDKSYVVKNTSGGTVSSGTAGDPISITLTGLPNDVTWYARQFPRNMRGQFQTQPNEVSAETIESVNLSTLPAGTLLSISENGMPNQFILLEHGYSDSGRTLLIRKSIYDLRIWGNKGAYSSSAIDTWLNGEYLNLFNAGIRDQISEVNVICDSGNCNRKVFLLSRTELGVPNDPIEGSSISYFTDGASRIATYNGEAADWWTRSYFTGYGVWQVTETGSPYTYSTNPGAEPHGSRPAFTLPATAQVNATQNEDGSYTVIE